AYSLLGATPPKPPAARSGEAGVPGGPEGTVPSAEPLPVSRRGAYDPPSPVIQTSYPSIERMDRRGSPASPTRVSVMPEFQPVEGGATLTGAAEPRAEPRGTPRTMRVSA